MRLVTVGKKRYGFWEFVRRLTVRYFEDDVGSTAAMLAYYFVFSFFPIILLTSVIIGFLDLSPEEITAALGAIVPDDVLAIVHTFIEHITEERSGNLLVFGAVFTLYFPMRAVNSLIEAVDRAYRVEGQRKLWKRLLTVFCFTLFLMVALFAALLLVTIGASLLTFLSQYFSISKGFITVWNYLRFLFLGAILFVILSILYRVSLDRDTPLRHVLPGAFAALLSWLLLSIGFAFYVENMANYSVIYGSIGAIIVLLIWLYFSAVVLVMGAEFNHVLLTMREEKQRRTHTHP